MRPVKLSEEGIALMALLLSLAIMSIALMAAVETWSVQRQREMEIDLLYTGNQYEQAIKRYYFAIPNGPKVFPTRIEDLVEDNRFLVPARHLRRAYLDPITSQPFELIFEGDRIIGVASKSQQPAIKRRGFSSANSKFEGLETYNQWKFVFHPPITRRPSSKLKPS